MFSTDFHEQTIMSYAQGGYLGISVESFLIDRQAAGLSPHTLKFYRQFLEAFLTYCTASALTSIQDVSSDFLRRHLLALSESHNPGGVHAVFRTLRAFFRWLTDEEIMAPEWENPRLKVRPPKVKMEPLEPIWMGDARALLGTCQHGRLTGDWDTRISRSCGGTWPRTMRTADWLTCKGALWTMAHSPSRPARAHTERTHQENGRSMH
jgi:hypothetical protein